VFDATLGTFATNMKVYPGRKGNNLPYGSANGVKLFTNKCWKNTGSPECDYGLIKLNKPLGNTVGWFGWIYYTQNSSLQDKMTNVRGYPGDKPEGTMWTMKGAIEQVTSTRIGYSIDTFGGQSGSPTYGKYTVNGSNCNPCSVGIHAYGVGATPFTTRNSGVRLTQKIFNFFCAKSDHPGC
jgi:glutamyl endopeptidase